MPPKPVLETVLETDAGEIPMFDVHLGLALKLKLGFEFSVELDVEVRMKLGWSHCLGCGGLAAVIE